jgi:signal transduction histidine kinase
MRLKTLFLSGIGLCAAMVVLASLAVVAREWRRAEAASEAAEATAVLRPALQISERFALERGGFNEALLADMPAADAVLRSLEGLRAQTDAAFDRTFEALRAAYYAEAAHDDAQLRLVRRDLARLRARAQAELARPKMERDHAFVTEYAGQMFDITARVTNIQAAIETAASRADPGIGQYAAVARVMGLVRDFAGRKQTLYVQILAGDRNVDAPLERRLGEADARIDVYWSRVLTLIDLTGEPRLAAMAQAIQHEYFETNAEVYARIRSMQPPSRGWSGDVASFRAWGVPTLQSLLKLRDVALEIANERTAAEARKAIAGVLAALAATVLFAATSGSFAVYFARSVVYPLSNLEGAVTRIAEGDLNREVPESGRANEIGRVARALDTLRLNLMAANNEQDEREHELRQSKLTAEAASRAKSEFLANMSHELRTPLNAVLGFSEIICNQLAGPVGDRYREYAENINKAGQHLLSLINDVLDLSKVEVGRIELDEVPVNLAQVIIACERIIRPRAASAGLDLVLDLPAVGVVVRGDERRLKQVILNLLSNAVKFTPRGGRVVAGTRALPTGETVVSVADTGIGMQPHEVPIALEAFRQIESALNRRHEGTGLGLPLAKNLVELHGGTLAIDTAPGEGTTVTVTLPAERCCANPAAA